MCSGLLWRSDVVQSVAYPLSRNICTKPIEYRLKRFYDVSCTRVILIKHEPREPGPRFEHVCFFADKLQYLVRQSDGYLQVEWSE